MGEVIQFPNRDPERREGAGHRPVPSAAPRPEPVEVPRPEPVEGPRPEPVEGSDEEPQWAVPVIGTEPPAREPERIDRAARRASNVAMAALARHDASEGEVRARLVAKGLEDAEVEAELERLRSVGLIDDAAFAERLVASLRERKGLGDGAIRSTLRTRLVPPAVADAVLAEQVEDEDALHDRLQSVADDRARRLTSLPYEVAERRLTAYLMRKGYSGGGVRTAARAALDGAGIR